MIVYLTRVPGFVKLILKTMPGVFRHRHALMFTWLLVLQIVCSEKRTIQGLSQQGPSHVTEWRLRRLLSAGYWSVRILLQWFVAELIANLPPPEDHTVYVITDGSKAEKRGKKNSVTQKGRISQFHGYFWGIRFVLLMMAWKSYRIPVDFEVILPKTHPEYQTENALFRQMLERFVPPEWARQVIVLADAGFASKDNVRCVKKRDQFDKKRRWYFVFAFARTWKTETRTGKEKLLKEIASSLTRNLFQKTWISKSHNPQRRNVFWTVTRKMRLSHIGDVTVVFSKKGRNLGAKNIRLIVTNLTGKSARDILSIYQKRWSVELLFWELKSGLGLGESQITKDPKRVEKSFACAIMAYLLVVRIQKEDIQTGKSWSIFQLKNNFILRVIEEQYEHSFQIRLKKCSKAA